MHVFDIFFFVRTLWDFILKVVCSVIPFFGSMRKSSMWIFFIFEILALLCTFCWGPLYLKHYDTRINVSDCVVHPLVGLIYTESETWACALRGECSVPPVVLWGRDKLGAHLDGRDFLVSQWMSFCWSKKHLSCLLRWTTSQEEFSVWSAGGSMALPQCWSIFLLPLLDEHHICLLSELPPRPACSDMIPTP